MLHCVCVCIQCTYFLFSSGSSPRCSVPETRQQSAFLLFPTAAVRSSRWFAALTAESLRWHQRANCSGAGQRGRAGVLWLCMWAMWQSGHEAEPVFNPEDKRMHPCSRLAAHWFPSLCQIYSWQVNAIFYIKGSLGSLKRKYALLLGCWRWLLIIPQFKKSIDYITLG